jgi:hypothetical protein
MALLASSRTLLTRSSFVLPTLGSQSCSFSTQGLKGFPDKEKAAEARSMQFSGGG